MKQILATLSTREISVTFWLGVTFVFLISKKEISRDFYGVVKTFFSSWQLVTIFCLFIAYQIMIIYFLAVIGLWSRIFLKDTVLWFTTIGLVLFFTIHKAKKGSYFTRALKESFKWTIIMEFVFNFYTFPLVVELITVPFMTLLILTKTFAENINKDERVGNILTKLIQNIGFLFIGFVIYKTIYGYEKLFTVINLQAITLPLIYIVCFVPFLYILSLLVQYEALFVRINCIMNDDSKKAEIKKAIIMTAKGNLNALTRIDQKFKKYDMYQSDDVRAYIKSLNEIPYARETSFHHEI